MYSIEIPIIKPMMKGKHFILRIKNQRIDMAVSYLFICFFVYLILLWITNLQQSVSIGLPKNVVLMSIYTSYEYCVCIGAEHFNLISTGSKALLVYLPDHVARPKCYQQKSFKATYNWCIIVSYNVGSCLNSKW